MPMTTSHDWSPAATPVAPHPPLDTDAAAYLNPPCRGFLELLLGLHVLEEADLRPFLASRGPRLAEYATEGDLGAGLVRERLLTAYQLARLQASATHGLVLGSYRVLDELGSGGMGVVYLAEHRLMGRRVAVKVLPVDEDCCPMVRQRFYHEMHVLAELHHPHIVLAFDAGELPPPGPSMPGLTYLVMELVEGGDLEKEVLGHGPMDPARACEYIRQAALGLQAAHDRHLIHRDVKPSNLLVTTDGRVKVVDFGLARQFSSKLTDPRSLLGSVEFMAPEQSHDPSGVGKAADVYGLGATLLWLLTGQGPYELTLQVGQALRQIQRDRPRRLRAMLPNAPQELDDLIDRMLDRNPALRPQPVAVVNALTAFLTRAAPLWPSARLHEASDPAPVARRALVVDDEPSVRTLARLLLERKGCECVEAADGQSALAVVAETAIDLLVLDLNLPGLHGYEVCRRLRERPTVAHQKVIVVSASGDANELADSLARGADDYIAKPFESRQLAAKIDRALALKDAEDRAQLLAEQLRTTNQQLEQSLSARGEDVRKAHDALLFALAKMAEDRDGETPGHLRRLQLYCLALAREVAFHPPWIGLIDDRYLQQLERCVPLHDIGKIALPDDLLLKPAALTRNERTLMQTHTLIGDRILEALGREYGSGLEFLGMARAIVRHHHERFDGRGYPDGLAGEAIPAAARLVALADVYDALRRQRQHKPALTHAEALRVMRDESPGQFDPLLLRALQSCHATFEQIYRDVYP